MGAAALAAGIARAQETTPPPEPTPVPTAEPAPPAPQPTPLPTGPPTAPGSAPLQASNILNPNVSLVGNLLGFVGNDRSLPNRAFELSEAELGLQSAIDPYARLDAFIAFSRDGVDIEETYVTWLALPASFGLKTGKFRSNLGKFNRTHPPETPFADRPLAAERFFGEEGLSAVGISASYLAPTPFYLSFDGEVSPNWEDAPLFGEVDESGEVQSGGRRSDLGYLFRATTYHDFSEKTNATLGFTYAHGVHDREGKLSSEVVAADATVRWKDPRRAIYRALVWQTEAYFTRREEEGGSVRSWGGFSYAEYQFSRRWRFGVRGDYVNKPVEKGGLAYITFWPSEFSAISLQGRAIRRPDGRTDLAAFAKLTFNIGPHGAHPF
jgi:hypothetical protein